MNSIGNLHRESMELAEQADLSKRHGEYEEAMALFRRALELEIQAVDQVPVDSEPTRSILYRSAATLALDCNLEREAWELAHKGLEGFPPDDIADELRDIIGRVHQSSSKISFIKPLKKLTYAKARHASPLRGNTPFQTISRQRKNSREVAMSATDPKIVKDALSLIKHREWVQLAESPIGELLIFRRRVNFLRDKGFTAKAIGQEIGLIIEGLIMEMAPFGDKRIDDPEWRTYLILLEYFIENLRERDMTKKPDDKYDYGLDTSRSNFFNKLLPKAVDAFAEKLEHANNQLRVNSLRQRHWAVYANEYLDVLLEGRADGKSIVEVLSDEVNTGEDWVYVITSHRGGGKTKTAYEVGNRCYDREFAAVVAVPIGDHYRTLDEIADFISKELNRRNVQGKSFSLLDKLNTIRLEMEKRRTLLSLDDIHNFDEEEWPQLREFLESLPEGSKIILTSQKPVIDNDVLLEQEHGKNIAIHWPVHGIRQFKVPPMSMEVLSKYVKQLEERSTGTLNLSEGELELLHALSAGVPSVVRSYLAQMRSMNISSVEKFDELITNTYSGTEPLGQVIQMIKDPFEPTYNLLNEWDRTILHLFLFFMASVRHKAICQVATGLGASLSQAIETLQRLYDVYLVERIRGDTYDLLPYIKWFVATKEWTMEERGQRLFANMEWEDFRKKAYAALGNYYINELRWLTIGDQVKFLGTEKGTVVELWRRHDVNLPRFSGKTRDRYTDLSAEDWEIVINLAGLIGRPLGILGQFEKRYEWGEYAMRACDALIIIAVQKEDNEKERKYREYREWFAVHDVAWAQDRLGRHETAIQIWKNSLQRAKEQGFKKVEALALYNMSKMALFQDIDNREELDQAEQLLQTSVGLWEELREREWVGHTKRILGLVLHRKGDPEAALDVLQVALDLLTAQDHDDGIIATLADMALVALSLNDPRAAPQFIESAIAKAAKLSAPAPVHAYALWKRAQMAAETDRPSEEVEVWMRASLKIYQATFADYWKREAQKWWDNYVGLADIASQNTQTQRVGALHMKPGRKEGMTQFKYDVFISHASKDNSIVDKIIQDFKREGITYWLDAEQIDFGDNIIPKIEEGLKMSRYVMPCLSQNLIKSGWCRQEYNSILNSELSGNSTRIVIPLKLDNCNDAEIPLLLKDKKRASYSDQAEYEKLLEFLRR